MVACACVFEKRRRLTWPVGRQEMPFAVTLKRWLLHRLKGRVPLTIIFFSRLRFFWLSSALWRCAVVLSAPYPVCAVAERRRAVSSGLQPGPVSFCAPHLNSSFSLPFLYLLECVVIRIYKRWPRKLSSPRSKFVVGLYFVLRG